MSNPAFGHGTDVGLLRDHNEDDYALRPEIGLWLVADGMGGHQCGEVASDLVSRLIPEKVAAGERLASAIASVHHDLHQAMSEGVGGKDMGSTVVAAQLGGGGSYSICWVGDSRAYLWDGSGLRRLTRDHSYTQRMLDYGAITEEESRNHPQRSVISQALGTNELGDVEVETVTGTICQGDRLLLCTDGLTSEVEDVEMGEILKSADDNQVLADRLIAAAKRNGGSDNITVILISAPDDAPTRTKKGGTTQIDSAALNSLLKNEAAVRKGRSLLLPLLLALLLAILIIGAVFWFFFRSSEPEPPVGSTLRAMPEEAEGVGIGLPKVDDGAGPTKPGLMPSQSPASQPLHSVKKADSNALLPIKEKFESGLPRISSESHPVQDTDEITEIIDHPRHPLPKADLEGQIPEARSEYIGHEEMVPYNQMQE